MRASNPLLPGITVPLMLLALLPAMGLSGADLVSRGVPTVTRTSGASASESPLLSKDARYVFFLSSASDLLAGTPSTSGALNVLRRDRVTGTMMLVSAGTNGAPANASCTSIAVSTNGQVAVFISAASNLSPVATNGMPQVFARDLTTGSLELISASTNSLAADGPTLAAELSADGLTVEFESQAANLVAGDSNGMLDVFVRARPQGETHLVSIAASGSGPGNGSSFHASLSADGRWVAFESFATNLTAQDLNTREDIYLRDLGTGITVLVSAAINGVAAGRCFNPRVNRDGSRVVFESDSGTLVTGDQNAMNDIFVWEKGLSIQSPTLAEAFHPLGSFPLSPTLNPDGAIITFFSGSPSLGYALHAWDAARGSNLVVSLASDGATPATVLTHHPILSDDSRYVFFLSEATNLLDGVPARVAQAYRRDLVSDTTRLVSATADGSPIASACTSLDAAGSNVVAFATSDDRLVPNDRNDASDVFVRDLEIDASELISSVAPDVASATPYGPSGLGSRTVLSGDGRSVVFTAAAPLVAADTNRVPDVYVRDLESGTVILASATAGGASGNGSSWAGAISRDGRYVTFLSRATDLAGAPTNAVDRVYLRDLVSGQTTLISRNTNGAAALRSSRAPAISQDGRFVVFESVATDLVLPDSNVASDIFSFDRLTQSNTLVSANYLGTASATLGAESPVLAQDGHSLFFLSRSVELLTNLTFGLYLYVRDLPSGITTSLETGRPTDTSFQIMGMEAISSDGSRVVVTHWKSGVTNTISVYDRATGARSDLVSSNLTDAVLSGDGRWVAYRRWGTVPQVMVYGVSTPAPVLGSVALDGSSEGNAPSGHPLLSADGRWLVFTSQASNLVAGDDNGRSDVFARDLVLGRTFLLSANASGNAATGTSAKAILGPDGRSVLFESFAPDLAAADLNDARDVFLARLSTPDSDGDGMDDDWEMVHFGNLSRDGTGDADGDGSSDLAEFKAGTQPNQGQEVLRVIAVTRLGDGATTLQWASTPGRSYAVQYKNALGDPAWVTLPGSIAATGTTASTTAPNPPAQGMRFYRAVALVP